ncbi:MAG: class I SAM-dependent methyltransferase [Candidatus Margulisiibacteriota bacterium]
MKIKLDLPLQVRSYWRSLPFAWVATPNQHALYSYLQFMQTQVIDFLRARGNGIRILEIACGTGRLAKRIMDECNPASLFAIDINPKSIIEAKKALSVDQKVTLVEGDIYNSEIRAKIPVADAVICFDALMHFPDLDELFKYVHDDVLADSGIFIGNMIHSAREEEMYKVLATCGEDKPGWARIALNYKERSQAMKRFRTEGIPDDEIEPLMQQGMLRVNSLSRIELERRLAEVGFKTELIDENYHLFFIARKV